VKERIKKNCLGILFGVQKSERSGDGRKVLESSSEGLRVLVPGKWYVVAGRLSVAGRLKVGGGGGRCTIQGRK